MSILFRPNEDGSRAEVLENDVVVGSVVFRAWAEESGVQLYLHNGYVEPTHRLRGVGTAIVQWAEAQLRTRAIEANVEDNAVFGATACMSEPDAVELLLDNGYVQVFSLIEMARNGTAPPIEAIPAGYAMRQAHADDVRQLWELNNVVYAGRDFVGVATEAGYQAFQQATDVALCWVVTHHGSPIAFVSSKHEEILELSVHPEHRRRGLARSLLSRSLHQLHEAGASTVVLHTNGENVSGARSLYESFGFVTIETRMRFRRPVKQQ